MLTINQYCRLVKKIWNKLHFAYREEGTNKFGYYSKLNKKFARNTINKVFTNPVPLF